VLVLILILVAAALLGHGYATENSGEVIAALVVAVLGVLVVVVDRFRARGSGEAEPVLSLGKPARASEDDSDEGDSGEDDWDESSAAEQADDDVDPDQAVVFAAGRTEFHVATCPNMKGKAAVKGRRGDLEAGDMTPCRRCLG